MTQAYVTLKVGSGEYLGTTKTVKEEIEKIPEVVKVDYVFGRFDLIVQVETTNVDELSRVVDKMKAIPNVISTETLICYLT